MVVVGLCEVDVGVPGADVPPDVQLSLRAARPDAEERVQGLLLEDKGTPAIVICDENLANELMGEFAENFRSGTFDVF